MPDGHPAGVQVFLYYWTHLLGDVEWIVKLPFVLAGIFSVWVVYRIAKYWFNASSAILSATYIASLQFFVLYSQIARPYISGLLFTSLMVLFWSRYLLKGKKKSDLVFFVLFAALSCYNHHFSLLFAAIVSLSGFWFVGRKEVKTYLIACFAIFVLYIPHLPIFFHQLQIEGIGGWLAKPTFWFPVRYLEWIMHFSVWVIVVLAVTILFFFFKSKGENKGSGKGKIRIVMLVWFLLPMVIGMGYSLLANPVIQYSMLIFSTPYLFIILFSYMNNANSKQLAIAVLLIFSVNISTLIFKREHYKILYKQPFEQVVKHTLELDKRYPHDVFMVDNYLPFFNNYYFNKYRQKVPYYSVRNKKLSYNGFDSIIKSIKQQKVVVCGLNNDYFQIVKKHFPYFIGYDYGFTFEEYTFSKAPSDSVHVIKPLWKTSLHFDKKNFGFWKFNHKYVRFDSAINATVYKMTSHEKFGPSCHFNLNDFTSNKYIFIDLSVTLKPLDSCSAVIVSQLNSKGKPISWSGKNIEKYTPKINQWKQVFYTMGIQLLMKSKFKDDSPVFLSYIFNPRKNNFLISEINITIRKGNPYRYGLYYDFSRNNM